jgi:hypothetical protein
MERLVLPNDTLAELHHLDRYFQVCDQSGRVLGYFTPAADQPLESPLSDAELKQRIEEPQRLTTPEVLEHWEKLR